MASYQSIEAGTLLPRGFPVVAKASGSPISAGTVNYYLKALTGANAGKWWRKSDHTWQATETANAMTYESADGNWSLALTDSPFADGIAYLEYVKESGDLHIPAQRWLIGEYTPIADSSRRVLLQLTQTGVTIPTVTTVTNPVTPADGSITAAVIADGAIDAGAIAADAITAAKIAADAVAEIQSGLSTLTAEDVNAEVDTALADINLDHLVKNAVDTDFATTVHLDSVVGHLADNGTAASFSRGSDSLEAIRDRGDAAWTTGGGAVGSNSVTFTVRNSSTLALLVGVPVNVYASDGTSLIDSETTGAAGTAVFSLDDGAYYYAVPPVAGYGSVAATSLTVDGVETVTISLVPISSASTAPGTRIVRCIVRGADGALKSGVVVTAKLGDASTVDQALIARQQLSATSDSNGIADLTCITSDQFTAGNGIYEFKVPNAQNVTSTVPAGSGVVYLEDLANPA